MREVAVCLGLALAAAACGGGDDEVTASASGTFAGLNGQTVEGSAKLSLAGDTVTLEVDITMAPDGEHGIAVFSVPACGNQGLDAGTTHWDATDSDPALHALFPGGHLGDLGNITIAGGTGTLDLSRDEWTLDSGEPTDAAPHAIVLHEMPDDGTMASAGTRHGCAVITVD